jgi:hypothetical protein
MGVAVSSAKNLLPNYVSEVVEPQHPYILTAQIQVDLSDNDYVACRK